VKHDKEEARELNKICKSKEKLPKLDKYRKKYNISFKPEDVKGDYLGMNEKVSFNKNNVRSNSESLIRKKKSQYKINEHFYRNKFLRNTQLDDSSDLDEFIKKD
jgi:hypothetical protein